MKIFFTLSVFLFAFLCDPAIQAQPVAKKTASYEFARAGKFMRSWYISSPIAVASGQKDVTESLQKMVFSQDSIAPQVSSFLRSGVNNTSDDKIQWKEYTSPTDVITLDSLYPNDDYAFVWATAAIHAPQDEKTFLGVGSDDGIRIWLNGKLVHDKWIGRGVVPDDDVVPIDLKKGTNTLVLKVQDMTGGWGFACRLLDKKALADKLYNDAYKGSADDLKNLLDNGVPADAIGSSGQPAIVAAKVSGHNDLAKLLISRGAKDAEVPRGAAVVDGLYKQLIAESSPGIAVLVAKGGNILYEKGFGMADVKNKVPITADTKFRIGSVTKQFTAAAILKLVEGGKISLQDHLSKFIPEFPRGNEVTIDELLTHTSGIHSYTSRGDFINRVTKYIAPDSLLAVIENDPFDFDPGAKYLYNNSAYFIAGYLVSKLSGIPYGEYLQKNFFEPLGMKNTGVYSNGVKLPNEAKGYSKEKGNYVPALDWDMSWAGGAGSLYSTVEDLLKWNRALYSGNVISMSSLAKMLTPAKLANGENVSPAYGYGLGMGNYRGVEAVGHSGGLHGFVTQLEYYPKDSLTVVMFSNTNDVNWNFSPHTVAEAFLWKNMQPQDAPIEADIKVDLDEYLGRYDLVQRMVITVTKEDNKLFAQLSGQAKYQIFPSAKDEFFWKIVPARLKFSRDENGKVNKATLFQNGQELEAKKLPPITAVKVDREKLAEYAGTYWMESDKADVVVSVEDGELYAHPQGQPKFKLEATGDDEFTIASENAVLHFLKNADGKYDKILLDVSGTKMELPRKK